MSYLNILGYIMLHLNRAAIRKSSKGMLVQIDDIQHQMAQYNADNPMPMHVRNRLLNLHKKADAYADNLIQAHNTLMEDEK